MIAALTPLEPQPSSQSLHRQTDRQAAHGPTTSQPAAAAAAAVAVAVGATGVPADWAGRE